MIKSIAHDQPQKNFKYLWLDFGFSIEEQQEESSPSAPIQNPKLKIQNGGREE
jgi:hypothetical protein